MGASIPSTPVFAFMGWVNALHQSIEFGLDAPMSQRSPEGAKTQPAESQNIATV
jgi:hypothetical protein